MLSPPIQRVLPVAVALMVSALLLGLGVWLGRAVLVSLGDGNHRERLAPLVCEAARRHHVAPSLIMAVVQQESRFDPTARGDAGEIGLMQIMPDAITDWTRASHRPCPSPYLAQVPELNLEIGTWYLARALRRWEGYADREALALAEYNAGLVNARKWAPDDPRRPALERVRFPGTRRYIDAVLRYRLRFQKDEHHRE